MSQQNMRKVKTPQNKFGILSLMFGALSLMLFITCMNYPLMVPAYIFGIMQLVKGQKKSSAIMGICLASLSLILNLIAGAVIIGRVAMESI